MTAVIDLIGREWRSGVGSAKLERDRHGLAMIAYR